MTSDSESSDIETECGEIVSEKIRQMAKDVSLDLLPRKSKQVYTKAYNTFKNWCKEFGTNAFCEDVILAYLSDLSKKYVPSSLWATYSMLRTTISAYNQIDISKYSKVIAFLKKQSSGYRPKKSLVFTSNNISEFLNNAPDDLYLTTKVALIFGIAGALRRQKLVDLKLSDVTESDDMLFVKVLKTKNKEPRSFTITGDLYYICKPYLQARKMICSSDRLFLKYAYRKCINQPIGINKFGSVPKEVATYLNLPEASKYTGHSFQRTSATLLVDAGADITTLKRHGGWKSNTVAEGYIADSINNKKIICDQLSTSIVLNKKPRLTSVISDTVRESTIPSTANQSHRVQIYENNNFTTTRNNTEVPSTSNQFLNESSPLSSEKSNSASTPPAANHIQDYNNRNLKVTGNYISATTPTSRKIQQVQSTYHQAQPQDSNENSTVTHPNTIDTERVQLGQRVQSNNNMTITKDSIVETSLTSRKIVRAIQRDPKCSVFYHPDAGLYIQDSMNEDSHKSLVFYNCNVTIQSDSYESIELHDCIANKSNCEN